MFTPTMILALMQTAGVVHHAGSASDVPTSPHQGRSGTVVVMSKPFALDLDSAQKLCPDGSRVRLVVGAADASATDPLGTLGSPTPALTVDATAPFAGDDMQTAQRAASATCIVLEGGTWSDWWRLLEPMNKPTRLGQAVVERHARGANVIGVGPAGAFLCEYSLLSRAQLQIPSRDPHDVREHVLVTGLGLVRGPCFDFAMDGRTTVEPLFEALRSGRVEQGVWLVGSCAWIQSGDGPLARIGGSDGAAYLFDLSAGRRSRDATFGGRAARLLPGVRFEDLPAEHVRDSFSSQSTPLDMIPLAPDPWPSPWLEARDPKNSENSRKAVELRGKRSRLRLFPEPGAGNDVPPPAHSPRCEWIRFDWIPIASAGSETRIEPQVVSCFACSERGPTGEGGFDA